MNHPDGYKVTILRPSRKGYNNRKLALHRRTKHPRHPKGFHISDQPRAL